MYSKALKRPQYKKLPRVALFIDGSNLFYHARAIQLHIDYAKLKKHLTKDCDLVGAWFYMGIDYSQTHQRSFKSYLEHIGYEVIAKQLLKRSDGTEKANLDVEIAIDLFRLAPEYDRAILVSGDQDFVYPVELVQQQEKTVTVVGLDAMTNDELKGMCDRFYDLGAMEEIIRQDKYINAA